MTMRLRARSQSGLSLIELMVALVIGILLLLGLVEIFSASRTAYQLSQGVARVQENGRFAMDFLQRDLRMAGHMGCVNDQARFLPENDAGARSALASTFLTGADQLANNYGPAYVHPALRFDRAIEAYDGNGSRAGDTVAISEVPTVSNVDTDWTPRLPAAFNAALSDRVAGSDVLVLRYFAPRGARMTGFAPGDPTATLTFDNTEFTAAKEALNVSSPGLIGVADCLNAGVFAVSTLGAGSLTTTRSGTLNMSALAGLDNFKPNLATLYPAEVVAYYVARKGNNQPALFRVRFDVPVGATDPAQVVPTREEIIEGIESLQVRFGQDTRTNPAERPTGNMGVFNTANAVVPAADPNTAWRRVGLVQVGVLARTPDRAAAQPRDASRTALSAVNVAFTTPNDARYRSIYEQSVALRNRLFGN